MLAALHISCNESRKMGTKMCKLLNVLCKKVETASILDEDENYFTPSDDLEIEQHSLNSANDDDTPTLFCKICVEPSQNPWMTVSTSKAVPTLTALNALSSTSNRNLKITNKLSRAFGSLTSAVISSQEICLTDGEKPAVNLRSLALKNSTVPIKIAQHC
ncbi:hypothetical protein QQP08_024757 [Theobroma cacao]|nr:hypothetical protein QQP08_024757 [Theobroma cacao]